MSKKGAAAPPHAAAFAAAAPPAENLGPAAAFVPVARRLSEWGSPLGLPAKASL
eukprot:CAMPEP_0170412710 /NCGR_PEP_ID=MMETSP0117_2-20130122/31122_1 /TAXON_ID=400756 /ORGANISM="Durinskia baltica, Strain CSIRO CS-38" /LENGTH=53 /DNA_ID=CAMNT_0010670435 /DNA_START=115 /DNA_END=276 /DNA_ORIENTATION=-